MTVIRKKAGMEDVVMMWPSGIGLSIAELTPERWLTDWVMRVETWKGKGKQTRRLDEHSWKEEKVDDWGDSGSYGWDERIKYKN